MPHVAQNYKGRTTAIDERTTQRGFFAIDQPMGRRMEKTFGWLKTMEGLRKLRHRGVERLGSMFTLAAAAD